MTDTYGKIVENILYPLWESGIRRRPTLRHLRELLRTQWYTRDELVALQSARLNELVKHAYGNVPYYAQQMKARGIVPSDIQSSSDLAKLPVLTRESARASMKQRTSQAGPQVQLTKSTSGSTGQPLEFGYDLGSEYWRQAVKLRGYAWAGHVPGRRTMHFWGALDHLYAPTTKKKLKVGLDRLLKRETFVDSNPNGEAYLDQVVDTIRKKKPEVLICFAQAGATLARHVIQRGTRDWDDLSVICGAERVFPADREAMQQAFGPVFETYGSREFMLMGSECEAHAGLHVPMEHLVVEVLVEEDGGFRSARPGETGEIAVTDLHNLGMPFIRYLTGDSAVQGSDERCRCGRALPRIGAIEGRVTETLRDGDGNAVNGLFFNVMMSVLADKIQHFQVVQRRDGSIDLRLVPTHAFQAEDLGSIRNNCDKFLHGVELRTDLVDEIPTGPSGKRRVVVVEH